MGGKNSKAKQLDYEAKDWTQAERSTFYEVMTNNNNGTQAQLYHFNIKSDRELNEEVDIYHRRRNACNWVRVLGAKVQKSGFGFCGTQENANVLTERIPYLLDTVGRLDSQESNIVLYNALRGLSDISRIIVPGALTERMIGFTAAGETRVWINQNFGMNYPSHYNADAVLSENEVISNLLNATSHRFDLTPNYIEGVRNSQGFNGALNFIRQNSGVATNLLEDNRINVGRFVGRREVPILRDTTPVVSNNVQTSYISHQPTTIYQPPVQNVQPVQQSTYNYQPYQPYQPSGHLVSSSYRTPSVNFTHGTSSNNYQIPNRYTEVSNAGQNRYSFTAGNQ